MTYYMVFERPVGSKCWTVAYGDFAPKYGKSRVGIEAWAAREYMGRKGWCNGVPFSSPMEWCVVPVALPA